MIRRGVWEVATWLSIGAALIGGWFFFRGLFHSEDLRKIYLAAGAGCVVLAVAVGAYVDSKIQAIVQSKGEKVRAQSPVMPTRGRVGLSHPLATLGIRSENIQRAIRWRKAIDACPGMICFAPWVTLAESDPCGRDEREGGGEWVRKVLEFDVEANRRCDVVVIVTRKIKDGDQRRRLISNGQEEEVRDLINNSRPRVYVGEGRLEEIERNPGKLGALIVQAMKQEVAGYED